MYQTLKLNSGIVMLTYVAPQDGVADAMIRPVLPLSSRHALTLMFEPGNLSGALTRPGEFCIIRCGQASILGIEIEPLSGTGTPRGGIDLTYLSQRGPDPAPDMTQSADFVLHLAGYGDRPARFGTWVGGDTPEHPIAGLKIQPKAGVPRVMMQDQATGQIAGPGDFLGSHGGFRPLSNLHLWIDGPDGSNRLQVSAEFETAGPVEATGTRVTLAGSGPADRLLRLKIAVVPMLPSGQSGQPTSAGIRRSDRVQIFRKA